MRPSGMALKCSCNAFLVHWFGKIFENSSKIDLPRAKNLLWKPYPFMGVETPLHLVIGCWKRFGRGLVHSLLRGQPGGGGG